MKTLKIFEKEHDYYCPCQLENDIGVIGALKEVIKRPFVLCNNSHLIDFNICGDDRHLGHYFAKWIYDHYKKDNQNIVEVFLTNGREDKEWTAANNNDMQNIFNRKIEFHEKVKTALLSILDNIEQFLTKALVSWNHELDDGSRLEFDRFCLLRRIFNDGKLTSNIPLSDEGDPYQKRCDEIIDAMQDYIKHTDRLYNGSEVLVLIKHYNDIKACLGKAHDLWQTDYSKEQDFFPFRQRLAFILDIYQMKESDGVRIRAAQGLLPDVWPDI